MKKALLVATTLVAVGCGSSKDSTSNLNNSPVSAKMDVVELRPAQGKIQKVYYRAVDTVRGGFMETAIVLSFDVGCYNSITPVLHKLVDQKNGSFDLIVSAYEKISKRHLAAICAQSIISVEQTITVPYFVEEQQLRLVNALAQDVKLDSDLVEIYPVEENIEVVSTSPLCPENAFCVTNGTVVKLAVPSFVGCVNQAVSHKLQQDGNKFNLYVGALNLKTKKSMFARCIQMPKRYVEINLINQFIEKDQIKLEILLLKDTGRLSPIKPL